MPPWEEESGIWLGPHTLWRCRDFSPQSAYDHTEYCQCPPPHSVKMHIWEVEGRPGQGRERGASREAADCLLLLLGILGWEMQWCFTCTPRPGRERGREGGRGREARGGRGGVICSSRGARLLGKGADNRQRVLWGVIWTLQGVGQPHQPDTPLLLSWYQINL